VEEGSMGSGKREELKGDRASSEEGVRGEEAGE
jgi:hypothetical protein